MAWLKHRAGPTKTVAGIEQAIDLRSVPRPLLDLVEIAQVGDQRIGGLLVEVNVIELRIGHGPDNRPALDFLDSFGQRTYMTAVSVGCCEGLLLPLSNLSRPLLRPLRAP